MNELKLRDFRCFHGEQIARLAPLTLVVGENSTGKTSFMAIIRALWEIAVNENIPDFKEQPYDLGNFAEITHDRGRGGGRADSFEAEFSFNRKIDNEEELISFGVVFKERDTAPIPIIRKVKNGNASMQVEEVSSDELRIYNETNNGKWATSIRNTRFGDANETSLMPMFLLASLTNPDSRGKVEKGHVKAKDHEAIEQLCGFNLFGKRSVLFASAPVRSRPRRTYDPARPARDPEGDYVPMYLAQLFRNKDNRGWNTLKEALQVFGQNSGLFDEISIKSLGQRESEPFQLRVRKRGPRLKGPWRNLIDVGYGVSQILPIVTEILREDAPSTFLLQQPEVHLHPSAQAALGSLFCQVASKRQLIVETHSDFLINRVRMDIRDGVSKLKPDDVSVLYFERRELDVHIHSLRIDQQGNLLDTPPSYGKFFMNEANRTLA